jgi:hypothetical protein
MRVPCLFIPDNNIVEQDHRRIKRLAWAGLQELRDSIADDCRL